MMESVLGTTLLVEGFKGLLCLYDESAGGDLYYGIQCKCREV